MLFYEKADAWAAALSMNAMGGYNMQTGYSVVEYVTDDFSGYMILNAVGEYAGGSSEARKLFSEAIADPNEIIYTFEHNAEAQTRGNLTPFINGKAYNLYNYNLNTLDKSRYSKVKITFGSDYTDEAFGLTLVHETTHAVLWNKKVDRNINFGSDDYTGMAEIHRKWHEAMAISTQYIVANQLKGKYLTNSIAKMYYAENGMYYIRNDSKKEVYGAFPITYSTYLKEKDGGR